MPMKPMPTMPMPTLFMIESGYLGGTGRNTRRLEGKGDSGA